MQGRNNRQLAAEPLEQRQLFCAGGLCLCGWDPVCGVDPAEVGPPVVVAPKGGPATPSSGEADLNTLGPQIEEFKTDLDVEAGGITGRGQRCGDVSLPVIPPPVCGDVPKNPLGPLVNPFNDPFESPLDDVVPPELDGQLCFPTGCESDDAPLLPVNPFPPEEKLEDILPPEAVDWEIALPNAGFALPDVDSHPAMSPEIERAIEEVGEELSRIYNDLPRLNDIPYASRLFQNRAVDPESTSLMLMVTPRIIIQLESDE